MNKKSVTLAVVLILLVVLLSACTALKDSTTANDLCKSFMAVVQSGDTAGSWQMLTPELQAQIGGIAEWDPQISQYRFTEWKFTNLQVEDEIALMEGNAVIGVDEYNVTLNLRKINEAWLISYLKIDYQT